MNRDECLDIIGESDVDVGLGAGLELIIGRQDRMVRIGLSPPGAMKLAIELLVRCRDYSIAEATKAHAAMQSRREEVSGGLN